MVQQLKDDLLHKRTRHTNLSVPCSKYVNGNTFPDQNKELLNTTVIIKYRNMYIADEVIEKGPDVDGDQHDIYETSCIVVRCDLIEPYRMICISTDYMHIFVTDSRYYKEMVVQYPIQFNEFIGIAVFDQYVGEIPEIKGCTLRVDNGEPCYTIIIEFLYDNYVRFVLGDECFSKLYDYYGIDNDYDGRDSKDYEEKFKDIDGGWTPYIPQNISFENIDGGQADILKNIFNEAKTDYEIMKLRESVLGGKKIYGSEEDSGAESGTDSI